MKKFIRRKLKGFAEKLLKSDSKLGNLLLIVLFVIYGLAFANAVKKDIDKES